MSESPEIPSPPAAPRDRSPEARKAARLRKDQREKRIIGLLNRGVSVAEIAARESISLNRMRKVVRQILERRMPQPPAEYAALQVNRLNEALLLSYSAMSNPQSGTNFKAIDSVLKVVRELDRYHGFAPAGARREPVPRRLPAPASIPLALTPPAVDRVENGAAKD